ncbi:PLP-dependent aminotransferase family protein [uncultured Streptomyces sp.]|uniref:MocR-like pyridoxine biosynthesis transcription factor PdxR n=1 Tax=uncultured Streptomyces sp. TaxID=174707 RepID=UPI00260DDD83|nr:PLP-dependent aminotransferase family protein [uncultured Streptomyces sp.]
MTDDRTDPAWGTFLELGAPADGPLHIRLARALRTAVTGGRIATGSTLPPSRRLAAELGCSRWVVTEAYAQLAAEGYLEARSGSATRVRAQAAPAGTPPPPAPADRPDPEFDLLPGVPDLRAFPRKAWADAVRDATRSLARTELGYPDAQGLPLLRQRLAAYLVRGRGAALDAGQLVVRGGTLDAVLQMCRLLRAAGHRRVAVEDPGWTRLRTVVAAEGLVPVPVPVDGDGLRVDLLFHEPQVRAVIVAPAHQFPTGVVLAPARRAALVAWARERDGLVLEDDYDAEFRYDRHPVGVLQGMAPEHVALMGSVSKTLSPALRIGWVAAPARWADALAAAGAPPPVIDQRALAGFLASGAYDRHLRAARIRYKHRRDRLLDELASTLPGLPVSGAAAGFHLLLSLGDGPAACSPAAAVREAARLGVRVADLDDYRVRRETDTGPPALVLGYGNLADPAVPGAVRRLAAAIDAAPRRET